MSDGGLQSAAQKYFAAEQRRYKPRSDVLHGAAYMQKLAHDLVPGMIAPLRDLIANGEVAIGELGKNLPDIRVVSVANRGLAIEVSSAMLEFTSYVASVLSSGDRLSLDAKVRLVRGAYKHWKRQWRWGWLNRWGRLNPQSLNLTKEENDWGNSLSSNAVKYMLAHELGHVLQRRNLAKPLSNNDEESADLHGIQIFLDALGPDNNRLRLPYAGAIFAIRLLTGLERSGFEFSEVYPPAAQRMVAVQREVAKRFPSLQYFHEFSTVFVAFQDFLDTIENRIFQGQTLVRPDADRVLVRLLAQLQMVAGDKVRVETFVNDIKTIAAHTEGAILAQAAATLVSYYAVPSHGPAYISFSTRVLMAEALAKLIDVLPSDLKLIFVAPPV